MKRLDRTMRHLDHDPTHPHRSQNRRARRAALRDAVIERSRGRCEWPLCGEWGTESAHLHSIGAGGRASADTLDNVMLACWDHARISDQEHGSGGSKQYRQALLDLLGFIPERSVGWLVAEALRRVVTKEER